MLIIAAMPFVLELIDLRLAHSSGLGRDRDAGRDDVSDLIFACPSLAGSLNGMRVNLDLHGFCIRSLFPKDLSYGNAQ